MKKLTIVAVLCALTIGLAGCGGKTKKAGGEKAGTVELNRAQFEAKVADPKAAEWKYLGDKPAIVDFYADWCIPCRSLAPILEDLAGEYGDKLHIYKVNIDQEEALAIAYKVTNIPNLMLIPMDGEPVTITGLQSKAKLKEYIDDILVP